MATQMSPYDPELLLQISIPNRPGAKTIISMNYADVTLSDPDLIIDRYIRPMLARLKAILNSPRVEPD